MEIKSIGTPSLWIGFTVFVLVALLIDLGVFNRHPHAISVRTALKSTAVWIGLALIFNLGIYHWFGVEPALQFSTGYLIEEALSVDNLFVFLVVFSYFKVPSELQHRVLFWGVLGALVLRGAFIIAGAALLQHFHWLFYIFAVFLIFTGGKLIVQPEAEVHPEDNLVLRAFRSVVPAVSNYRGMSFVVREEGRRRATPLLMVLVVIEATDLVFAVDSVPAIFAVTSDPFIVYTSNIFAILGLRSLFFALAAIMDRFHYLKFGLGLVLMFVGGKMLTADWYHIPVGASLGVVVLLLAGSIVVSLLRPRQIVQEPPDLPVGQRESDYADAFELGRLAAPKAIEGSPLTGGKIEPAAAPGSGPKTST